MFLIIRSLIFNIVFFSVIAASMICAIPLLLLSEECIFGFWKYLSTVSAWITKVFAGINVEIDASEKLSEQGVIYAVRHESAWETLELIHMFDHPIFVMKKELFSIPIFGAMAKKSGAIAVDRDDGVKALTSALKQIKEKINQGHSIVIFPEGTRMPTGVFKDLKRGIALFYRSTNCKVIPVVHNSGKFWPARGFIKYPGTIKLRVFPAIETGLNQNEFLAKLNDIFRSEVEKLNKE